MPSTVDGNSSACLAIVFEYKLKGKERESKGEETFVSHDDTEL